LAYRVIMIILSVGAVILIEWDKLREEQVGVVDREVRSIRADIKHLPVKGVVEFEFDGRVSVKQITR